MIKEYYVYIITNHTNNVFYTGITNDLSRRIYEHKNGINTSSFSKSYRLYKLIWYESFPTPQEAIVTEKKIKGWIRAKKLTLIRKTNPGFQELTLR